MEKNAQSSHSPTSASNQMPGRTSRVVGLEEFIEAASNGVLRAIEARKVDDESPIPFPPNFTWHHIFARFGRRFKLGTARCLY